ncbi:M56 family metallopeptidase [Chryseobacterium luquanense]|uniref:M56 family metallopeptidase n=1 Tax=Chryseobacterium luquanense TaxID=2983766 RepID=A0ABT3Y5D7_9FLAO|nr:M56 family metallopeptidase [Chryseobacterium luquanense]MCX8533211.1 M56 family metallopeptidase [Chryseobacterium luquanense]
METIILKTILCSGVLLGLYHLFLAKERTFIFNRFYLILALIFSFSIPFATIETKQVEKEIPETVFVGGIEQPILQAPIIQQESFDFTEILIIVYFIITGILLLKIIYSILKIKRLKGQKIIYQNRKVFLLQQNLAPFSFWNTIYLSENYLKDSKIDNAIFLHEEIHIKQKHSADILFVEILKAISWFNPFMYFYKKAMINNHEFIADESVILESKNVKKYQELILQEILKQQNLALIHQFNFNNTKKRFIMMTKKNSKFAKAKKYFAIPAFAVLTIVFAEKTYAKESSEILSIEKDNVISKVFSGSPYEEVQKILNKYQALLNDKKYAEFDRKITAEDRQRLIELYAQLTENQKDELPFIFHTSKKFEKNSLNENDLKEFSNSKKYGLWIDEKKVDNTVLKNYQASDFSHKFVSKRYKNAISKKNPQPFQVNLMTNAYYEKYSKEEPRVLMGFKAKNFVKGKDTIPVKRNIEAKNNLSSVEDKKTQDIAYGQAVDLTPAEYPGGASKLRSLVASNFDGPIMTGDEGTLKSVIYFNVDENGKVNNFNATGENEKFNTEAIRVVKLANQDAVWKPAQKDGKAVKYRYKMPLTMNFETYKKTQ